MKMLVSRQALSIYRTLINTASAMTAEQIALQLKVSPNAIYRSANQLIELGMVRRSKSYPVRFKALSASEALPWYLLNARKAFKDLFGEPAKEETNPPHKTAITVVKNRDDFLRKTTLDALKAQETINIIVSGLEVPDKTLLAYRQITAKGVRVRAIVQHRKETSHARLIDWGNINVEVRYMPYMGIRLFTIDELYTYLVSYGKDQKELALGVRYNYPPLAATMNELFEQKWQKAKPL